MIYIESGIPVPPPRRGNGRPAKYPFAEMAVGQSISVSGAKAVKNARAAALMYQKKHPEYRMVARRVSPTAAGENPAVPKIRIWKMLREVSP